MTEILIKAKTMYAAMIANIQKGDPKSDNMKGLTEVSSIISSLITTIESQKEEIEKWRKMHGQERQFSEKFQQERDEAVKKSVFWEDHCGNSELRIESLKAITELAVKGLRDVLRHAVMGTVSFNIAVSTLSEIERLQKAQKEGL